MVSHSETLIWIIIIITQHRIKKLVNTLCSDLEIKLVFTPFKIKSWFGAKDPIPASLRCESFTSFLVQAVVPVILVKPIDTLLLAFMNILPRTNILTSSSTWEALKIVAPFVQKIVLNSWTLLPQASNWKLKKPCTSLLWEQPSLNSQVKHLNLSPSN